MNLHGIVVPYIAIVNPMVPCLVSLSTGNIAAPDGTRIPTYADFPNQSCQVQPVTTGNLKLLDGLNIQGIYKSIYLNGNWQGVDRSFGKGGDMITMQDGTVWLVTAVAESWPDWTHLIVTKQINKVKLTAAQMAFILTGV